MSGTWWPAAGWRTNNSGAIGDVGGSAYYWSSTRHSNAYQSYSLAFNYNGNVTPSYNYYRSTGFSVRCVQEEGRRFARDLGLGMWSVEFLSLHS